jgi:polar amino acid transport system substrate-binding protein
MSIILVGEGISMKRFNNYLSLVLIILFSSCSPQKEKAIKSPLPKEKTKQKKVIDNNLITLETVNWAPYYDESLPNGGPVVDISREAFKAVGLKMHLKFVPWKRAMLRAKNGYIMGLFGAYITYERGIWGSFNEEPIAQTINGIVTKSDSNIKINSLKDLAPYEISYLLGSSISPKFDNATYLKKRTVVREELSVKMLLKDRLKFIAGDISVFRALTKDIKGAKGSDLKLVLKLKNSPLYIAFSKKNKNFRKIRDSFDKGLRIIKKNGIYLKILKKHNSEKMADYSEKTAIYTK